MQINKTAVLCLFTIGAIIGTVFAAVFMAWPLEGNGRVQFSQLALSNFFNFGLWFWALSGGLVSALLFIAGQSTRKQ
ncbi:MAG: hypothetical protein ACOH2N_18755 [Devosia sp.]